MEILLPWQQGKFTATPQNKSILTLNRPGFLESSTAGGAESAPPV